MCIVCGLGAFEEDASAWSMNPNRFCFFWLIGHLFTVYPPSQNQATKKSVVSTGGKQSKMKSRPVQCY